MTDAQRRVAARHAELNVAAATPKPTSFLRMSIESNALGPHIAVTAQLVAGAWHLAVTRDGVRTRQERVHPELPDDPAGWMAIHLIQVLTEETVRLT